MKVLPANLVALSNLVHAPREGAENGQEHGHGTGSCVRDPASVSDRSESSGRRAILEKRHVLHAGHSWFVPDHSLRHLFSLLFFPVSALSDSQIWGEEESGVE